MTNMSNELSNHQCLTPEQRHYFLHQAQFTQELSRSNCTSTRFIISNTDLLIFPELAEFETVDIILNVAL